MGIKILHTADWHIGKQLLKVDFSDDMELFFKWLIKTIKEKKQIHGIAVTRYLTTSQ